MRTPALPAALWLALASSAALASPIAFTHVNVLPMDSERVLADQTVVVDEEKIVALGPSGTLALPEGATIVDASGRFLLPGLTDAHTHLDLYARRDFGDAPLFLAYGVTTVFNLRGGPEALRMRDEIRQGKRLAPNLYTSGEFINEPRVVTAEDVSREVRSQAEAGYDFVKFHELPRGQAPPGTTTGLSREAYDALGQAAREAEIPLVGHAAQGLGLDATLEEHQNLSHVGELTKLILFPRPPIGLWFALTLGSLAATGLASLVALGLHLVRRLRRASSPEGPRLGLPLGIATALASATLGVLVKGYFAGGWVPFALAVLGAALAILCAGLARVALSRRPVGRFARALGGLAAAAVATFALSTLAYWLPGTLRATDAALADTARRCRGAEISVMSTLAVYERGTQEISHDVHALVDRPELELIPAGLLREWKEELDAPAPLFLRLVIPGFESATHRVARSLVAQGVPVLAGTDANGFPWLVPGASLHDELRLLVASGFTPYQALRAATAAPAAFVHHEDEFGTLAPGKRADLLLVDQNPLEHLDTLRRPLGVMVRGQWLRREALDAGLASLPSR